MVKIGWLRRLNQLSLHSSRKPLRIWLLLPLVAGLVWALAGWMSQQVLSYSYETSAQLRSGQPSVELRWQATITAIAAAIDKREGVTEVTVRTAHPVLKELELDLPATEFADIEAALAEELGLPPLVVRQLTRYRLE